MKNILTIEDLKLWQKKCLKCFMIMQIQVLGKKKPTILIK